MSINSEWKRLRAELEGRTSPLEEEAATLQAKQRFLEEFAKDFERRIPAAAVAVEEGRVSSTDLRRKPPMDVAAVYAVLASGGDPRAEDVKALYDEVKEERRRHHSMVELEEWSPGIGREYDAWFWEMVERHAERRDVCF
jgi:hypothetical protein